MDKIYEDQLTKDLLAIRKKYGIGTSRKLRSRKPHFSNKKFMRTRARLAMEYYKNKGYKIYQTGWPDLVIVNKDVIRWIEIKSMDELVRPNQKIMHEFLKKHHNIVVEIVRFELSPDELELTA